MQNYVDSFWPENSSASQSVSLYLSLILIAYSNSLLFPYSGAELSKASRIANEHINSSSRKESTASLAEPPSNLTRLMLISFYEMHRFFFIAVWLGISKFNVASHTPTSYKECSLTNAFSPSRLKTPTYISKVLSVPSAVWRVLPSYYHSN